MPNLNPREVAEIQRRERENAAARETMRKNWNYEAHRWMTQQERERAAAQDALRSATKIVWKRGPVEVVLTHSLSGLRMQLRVHGGEEVRLGLARFDQKLIFDHIRRTIGNFGRETREGGALVGLKMLYLNGTTLHSPQRHNPWPGAALAADHPPTELAEGGIYALWPARKNPYRMYGDLINYFIPKNGCLVRVLGTGRCVIGTKGWRAEHCVVTDIWTGPQEIHRYSHFRERGIGVHDWDKKYGHR